jgi:hypothetical protein
MKTCALATAMLLILQAGSSAADTIHYWQFEDSPGLLEDSVGLATLSAFGSGLQVTLPESGRGSSFDVVVEGTTSAVDVGSTRYLTTGHFTLTDFTVEVLAHADTLTGSFGNTLAGAADAQQNTAIGWILQVRYTGIQRELALILCNGSSCELNFSGIPVATGKDYFLAAAVDLDGGETTFYVQTLTDGGPLQSEPVSYSTTSLNAPANFAIGATGNGNLFFDGLIDEVRISNTTLSEQQLLIPEPSVIHLLAMGIIGLGWRRSLRG